MPEPLSEDELREMTDIMRKDEPQGGGPIFVPATSTGKVEEPDKAQAK